MPFDTTTIPAIQKNSNIILKTLYDTSLWRKLPKIGENRKIVAKKPNI